jgi:hypothetical protein
LYTIHPSFGNIKATRSTASKSRIGREFATGCNRLELAISKLSELTFRNAILPRRGHRGSHERGRCFSVSLRELFQPAKPDIEMLTSAPD